MAQAPAKVKVTQELARFYNTLDFARLPAEVVDRAKYVCLDFLSVAVRGQLEPSAKAVVAMVRRLDRPGQSVVMGTAVRTAPEYAALAKHIIENEMLNGEVIRLDGAIRMAPK